MVNLWWLEMIAKQTEEDEIVFIRNEEEIDFFKKEVQQLFPEGAITYGSYADSEVPDMEFTSFKVFGKVFHMRNKKTGELPTAFYLNYELFTDKDFEKLRILQNKNHTP